MVTGTADESKYLQNKEVFVSVVEMILMLDIVVKKSMVWTFLSSRGLYPDTGYFGTPKPVVKNVYQF